MFKVLCSTFKVENNAVIPAWFWPESSKYMKTLDTGLRNLNNLKVTMGSSATGMTKLMN